MSLHVWFRLDSIWCQWDFPAIDFQIDSTKDIYNDMRFFWWLLSLSVDCGVLRCGVRGIALGSAGFVDVHCSVMIDGCG